MREKKEARRALYTAIQKLADSSTNFEGEQAAKIVRQAAEAYIISGLLDDAPSIPTISDSGYRSSQPSDPFDGVRKVLAAIHAVRATDPSIPDT